MKELKLAHIEIKTTIPTTRKVNKMYGRMSHRIRDFVLNNIPLTTSLIFRSCGVPRANPNFVSKNRSRYWYFETKEGLHYFIRQSNHWSNSCGALGSKEYSWYLSRKKPTSKKTCGFIAFNNKLMQEYEENFTN